MFELTISTALADSEYISNFYNKFKDEIKRNSCLVEKINHFNRSYVTFAIKNELKDYFIAKILDEIVFIIIDRYKTKFFKEHLIEDCQNVLFQSFLKSISIFDSDIDRDCIVKNIEFSGHILIDSLYHFKLQELQNRWQKTIDMILFNGIHKQDSSMIDIMKYLTTMSDNLVQNAEVEILDTNLKIKFFEKIKNYKNDFSGLSNFLTEMIELNPARIVIKSSDESGEEVVSMLCKIFHNKIIF